MPSDKLKITPEQARASIKEDVPPKRSEDTRFWKPRLKKEENVWTGEYEAMTRLLPQGLAWLKDRSLPFAVEQHTHYIREPFYRVNLFVKCRKTLGLQEQCPICDATWAIYNNAKDRNDEKAMKKAKSRLSTTSYIANILVIEDLNDSTNNGEIKLWDHTKRVNNQLIRPFREETEEETKERTFKKQKKKEIFTPWCPVEGRNYVVLLKPALDNPTMLSYDESFWDDKGLTPLADTDEAVTAILERCYDLREFIEDVPSPEELIRRYAEFNERLNDAAKGKSFTETEVASDTPSDASPAVSKGDSKSYFAKGDDSAQNESASPEASVETAVEEAPQPSSDDDGDEELPF